jgi:ATP-dependent DNA helicase RecG
MTEKHWITTVLLCLEQSLSPVPHEVNELDWKASLSEHKDRLAEHLIAFANYPNGGSLVFGVTNSGHVVGVDQTEVAQITNTLANLGRDAVEPPLALDHAVVDFKGVSILLVHIPEQAVKPVRRRGKTIEESWVRSGGTTRKASRQEVGALMLNSATPRWEELRASQLLNLNEVLVRLDVATIAKLLERPLPSDAPSWGNGCLMRV